MMKGKMKKILSVFLSLILIIGTPLTASAVNENNTLGVTFSAVLDNAILSQSDEDQTVTMYLKANKDITLDGMGLTVVQDSPLILSDIMGGDEKINIRGANYNLENGKVGWQTDDAENIQGIRDMLVATFTVPAGTPAGTYEVGVKDIELSRDYGDIAWETTASASATLTITDKEYIAGVNTLTEEVSIDDTVMINVDISHSSDTVFAAGEIIIDYDDSRLLFNQDASTLGAATVKDNNGILMLEDYGADKMLGTGVYALAFDAIADGNSFVTISSAAFVNKENAVKNDLVSAVLSPASVELEIAKRSYNVELPDIFTGFSTVVEGEDYTFSKADGDNYDYGAVKATINGAGVTVIDNGDGTYTVPNVTGNLVITGSRTAKTYEVIFTGNAADDITDGMATATYDTDYTFTMPSAEGWAYSLDEIIIGGETYTGYTVEGTVYTIPGTAITGNIQITVSKSATVAGVTVEGTGAGAASGYETQVNIGEDYTLSIIPEAGYTYSVNATMNGEPVFVIDNGDNTYTIQNVTGNVVFEVTRTVIVDGVAVSRYLTLDGTVMWLIKNEVTLEEGKVPTYNGEKMFWSEEYNAYCYLEIVPTLSVEEASDKVDIIDGNYESVNYSMDVNITGKVDASDAQLTYNMYNAFYNEFTDDITIEKFLRADVNSDTTVDVKDAAAIINYLLSR